MQKIVLISLLILLFACSQKDAGFDKIEKLADTNYEEAIKYFQSLPFDERIRLYKIDNKISDHNSNKLYLASAFNDKREETFNFIISHIESGDKNDFYNYRMLLFDLIITDRIDICKEEKVIALKRIQNNIKIQNEVLELFKSSEIPCMKN